VSVSLCPLCSKPPLDIDVDKAHSISHVKCRSCGTYVLDHFADLDSIRDKLYLLSGLTRGEHEAGREYFISADRLQDAISSARKPQPLEAIDIILRYLQRKTGDAPGQYIELDGRSYPLVYGKEENEMVYYIGILLKLGYIEDNKQAEPKLRLTIKGWERLAEISLQQRLIDQAFVAMWFNPSVEQAYTQGIQPALEQLHYHTVVMNRLEHNDKICDRIIAEIRKSSLVIADFTGHRGGVYFEAGFALGLGIPVIWTCQETDLPNTHFDTRQYNHIVWSEPEDLRQKLVDRIEATITLRPA
jgi:nucleoside 2-deoxyribosyltransferase